MRLINEEKHQFNGDEYVIRVIEKGDEFVARGFLDNKPMSYMYSVERNTRFSFQNSFGYDPVLDMIKSVKQDIEGDVGKKFTELRNLSTSISTQ
jgi:hypothetical protein